ncbi:endonuclease [Burkholderia phage BcepSauron]|uniref:Endonuclease n=2 Tax=Sarumanvirus TaxID=2843450 RepID=A0A482MKF6_9CAUD|nr:HNH endonuclease [Burkholderia phage BcepSaruman]YP_009904505.1 endonuclease [Burkholderia phage BcepSauron]QBQ74507.1 endonuclease [Burkholderia phage BcepSauron]QBX06541.1 HNH endonuclease [Burkholderia phage BcepSaruman]
MQISKISNRCGNYERIATLELGTGLRAIVADMKLREKERRTEVAPGLEVHTTSKRLRCFANHGTTCSSCGLEATHFAVERTATKKGSDGPFHMNMWGFRDGEEVIFTHDHTVSRANGGADAQHNMTTMCGPCNWEKGLRERV